MLWIGITGPIGSGKSTVAQELRQMGYSVLDADQVAHHVMRDGSPAATEVQKVFGKMDRRALGRVVFADPQKLATLESIVHPFVRAYVAEQRANLASTGHAVAFYDVPLLFERNMQDQFDRVLVVSSPEALRKQRVMARSGLSEQEFLERQSRQLPAELKEQKADFVIVNDGVLESLRANIRSALSALKIPSPTSTDP